MSFVDEDDPRPMKDIAACECGDEWFTFSAGEDDEGVYDGTVRMNGAGDIIEYSAVLQCNTCGKQAELPQYEYGVLRLIKTESAGS